MRYVAFQTAVLGLCFVTAAALQAAEATKVVEEPFNAPNDVAVKLRMEGPYTADVPLQVVCYFRYSADGVKRMAGAPVELDKELHGVIGALRERGDFQGDALETLLIQSPAESIKAKALLLIGLGDESDLSLATLEDVGKVALREAVRVGATRVGFAPMIRDQGNTAFDAGEVERAIIQGVLLAYDTEKRLQSEGLAEPYTLSQWNVEAGPTYFEATKVGLQKGIAESAAAIKARSAAPYATAP